MNSRGQLWILTGERGSGKTLCLQLVVAALQKLVPKVNVQGLMSPGVFKNDRKVVIQLLDIGSGQEKILADRRSNGNHGPSTKHWSFHQSTLDWGNQQLRTMPPSEIFIIDELGPLELERGEGLQAALPRMEDPSYSLKLAVIRPSLIDRAQQRWPIERIIDLDSHQSYRQAAQAIAKSAALLLRKDLIMTDSAGSKRTRLAFVSDDGETISSHFGRAQHYVVISLSDGEINGREIREKFSPHSAGGQQQDQHDHQEKHRRMVQPIQDCQLVVARGMGYGAHQHLESAGLDIILTDLSSIDEAVQAYVAGELSHQPDRLHHGHGHHDHE